MTKYSKTITKCLILTVFMFTQNFLNISEKLIDLTKVKLLMKK